LAGEPEEHVGGDRLGRDAHELDGAAVEGHEGAAGDAETARKLQVARLGVQVREAQAPAA
jgi:hypothetical protein